MTEPIREYPTLKFDAIDDYYEVKLAASWKFAAYLEPVEGLGWSLTGQSVAFTAPMIRDLAAFMAQLSGDGGESQVTIPLRVAQIIRAVFIPRNPNKARTATPEVKEAAWIFIQATVEASL
jgi:hypothetical protein